MRFTNHASRPDVYISIEEGIRQCPRGGFTPLTTIFLLYVPRLGEELAKSVIESSFFKDMEN